MNPKRSSQSRPDLPIEPVCRDAGQNGLDPGFPPIHNHGAIMKEKKPIWATAIAVLLGVLVGGGVLWMVLKK